MILKYWNIVWFWVIIKFHALWNPSVKSRIQKGPPIMPILSRINPVPRFDKHFFNIRYNIVLRLSLPKGLFPVKILIAFLPSSTLALCPAYFNFLYLITLTTHIRWRLHTMKFLIVTPSPLTILVSFRRKYWPQDHVPLAVMYRNMFHNHVAQLAIVLFYIFDSLIGRG